MSQRRHACDLLPGEVRPTESRGVRRRGALAPATCPHRGPASAVGPSARRRAAGRFLSLCGSLPVACGELPCGRRGLSCLTEVELTALEKLAAGRGGVSFESHRRGAQRLLRAPCAAVGRGPRPHVRGVWGLLRGRPWRSEAAQPRPLPGGLMGPRRVSIVFLISVLGFQFSNPN